MRVAVVGAGIGGLTAAFRLSQAGADVVVFEGSDRVGGKLRSDVVGDLTLDVGAESVLARRPEGLDLIEAVGLGDKLVNPEPLPAMIWTRGALRAMPPTVMGVPSDVQAALDSGILTEPLIATLLEPATKDESVAEFVSARIGREVVDRLIEPLLGGVYAGRVDLLSLRATSPLIAQLGNDLLAGAQARRAASVAGVPVLAGLAGGMWSLPGAIVEAGDLDIRLNQVVRAVLAEGSSWQLIAGNSTQTTREVFDSVVVATPAPATARLIAESAPVAAFALAEIEYASMAVVTFVLRGAELPDATGFLVPAIDKKSIKASTFATTKWGWLSQCAGGSTVVRASLGRAGDSRTLQLADADVVHLAQADLVRALGESGTLGRVEASSVQRWGAGLPQYAVGHLDIVQTIDTDLANVPGLEVCGAAYRGLGVAAVVDSGNRAAERTLSERQ